MELRIRKVDFVIPSFRVPRNSITVGHSGLPKLVTPNSKDNHMRKLLFQNQRGSAILITMALILMLSAVGMMAITQSSTEVDVSFNKVRQEQSLHVAEAGLSLALAALNADTAWRTGYANQALGNGEFSVAVLDSSSGLTSGDTVIFQSTAAVPGDPGSSVTLEAWLVPTRFRPFQYAVFSAWWLRMDGDGCTDSFNSDSGSYADTQADCCGAVGSNDELRLRDNVVINGDVYFAGDAATDLDIDASVTIGGDTLTSEPPLDLPIIPQSEFDWAESVSNAPAGFSGNYAWTAGQNKLILNNNDTMVLSSGVYYFGTVTLKANSAIKLAPGAEVTIYSTKPIEMQSYSSINAGGTASDLTIWASSAARFRMDDYTEFRGGYYGPESDMRIRNSADIYGSVTVQRHTIDVGDPDRPCFHYDRGMMNRQMGPIEEYVVYAWRQL